MSNNLVDFKPRNPDDYFKWSMNLDHNSTVRTKR